MARARGAWLAGVAVAALGATATPRVGQAQKSTALVVPEQPLSIGVMLPGVQDRVTVQDGWRRASLRVEGSGRQTIRFVLPAALVSATGATLPLLFDASSGATQTSKNATLQLFDPWLGTGVNLTAGNGTAWIYMGVVATPAALQPTGNYSGTVTVVIAPPNM